MQNRESCIWTPMYNLLLHKVFLGFQALQKILPSPISPVLASSIILSITASTCRNVWYYFRHAAETNIMFVLKVWWSFIQWMSQKNWCDNKFKTAAELLIVSYAIKNKQNKIPNTCIQWQVMQEFKRDKKGISSGHGIIISIKFKTKFALFSIQ